MALEVYTEKFGPFNNRYWGTAPPSLSTDGTYKQGDVVFATTPTAGNPWYWVCVAGGTPGTWNAGPNL